MPCLKMSSNRIALMPPPVEPAQPPMKDSMSNKKGRKFGQLAKSCVVKPVVVAIDTV